MKTTKIPLRLYLFLFSMWVPYSASVNPLSRNVAKNIAALPYYLGYVIMIILFFCIILCYSYDTEDREYKGYGRFVLGIICLILCLIFL